MKAENLRIPKQQKFIKIYVHVQGRLNLIFHDFGITESRVSDLVQLRSLVWRYWSLISRPDECSNMIMMWDDGG